MHLRAIKLPSQPITLAGSGKGNWKRVQYHSSGQNSLQLQPSVIWGVLWNLKTRFLPLAKTSVFYQLQTLNQTKSIFRHCLLS